MATQTGSAQTLLDQSRAGVFSDKLKKSRSGSNRLLLTIKNRSTAYGDIKSWEDSHVKTSDADFESKRDIMLDIGEKIANSGVSPSSWLPLLKNEYEVLSRGMSLASKRTNASKQFWATSS